MNDLVSVALAAILTVVRGEAAEERDRLEEIARDVAAAVAEHESDPPLFRGPGAQHAAVLMLVAIAKHESEFKRSVDTCERRGDVGRSITLFQLMRGPNWGRHALAEICADRRLAARLALRTLARARFTAPRANPLMLANGYASGSPGRSTRAGREICEIWHRLATQAGLSGASCHADRPLGAPPPPASGAAPGGGSSAK